MPKAGVVRGQWPALREPEHIALGHFADSLADTGKNVKQASGEGGKELVALLKELRDTNKGLQKRLENVEAELFTLEKEID